MLNEFIQTYMNQSTFSMVVIVVLPLVPAVILYALFKDKNFTQVALYNQGIKAGGPVALYIVIFLFLLNIPSDGGSNLKLLKAVEGKWHYTTVYSVGDGQTKTYKGNAEITVTDKGRLCIVGMPSDDGSTQVAWKSGKYDIDETELLYVFNVSTGSKVVLGVSSLNLHFNKSKDRVESMNGTWGVLGQAGTGSTNWERL